MLNINLTKYSINAITLC